MGLFVDTTGDSTTGDRYFDAVSAELAKVSPRFVCLKLQETDTVLMGEPPYAVHHFTSIEVTWDPDTL